MSLSRRDFLGACAGAIPALAGGPTPAADKDSERRSSIGVVEHSYGLHSADRKARTGKSFREDPFAFLDFCHERGFAGVQMAFGSLDEDDFLHALIRRAESLSVYLEGSIRVPRAKSQSDQFKSQVPLVWVGEHVFRTALLEGRRYETFADARDFRRFADQALRSLLVVKPIVKDTGIRLAVENHKDWRVDQLIELLERVDSDHIGACLDTGNNLVLLEDPMEVVEKLAPWAFTTHLKDIAVEPYADGFLMSEVPLGEGILDLKRVVRVLRDARPEINFNIEMITRDPLKIPCLTERYWATMEGVSGRDLARTLALVRDRVSKQPLPRISGLSPEAKLKAEDDNVRRCLAYARDELGL